MQDDIDRTALIDLVMGHVSAAAKHEVVLNEVLRDKYARRSRLFADEAELIVQSKGMNAIKGSRPHVLVIGATAVMIEALVDRGFEVSATDICPDVVGANICGSCRLARAQRLPADALWDAARYRKQHCDCGRISGYP
jgi:hypothetical protein